MSHSLNQFFHPTSVAVVGATDKAGSVGSILMQNLLENPFGGVVYPINPKRRSTHGVYTYPELKACPGKIDLVVIATPAATVPGVIRECVNQGVHSAIIISAGFSELGAEGRRLEQEIREIARGRMRIIGPNCLGVIHPPSNLNASFAATMAAPGKVALLSQSGAICTSILDWAKTRHIGFSSFVSVGSMLDVDFADLMDYFADDENTRSIILYMESIGNVRKFLSAARSVSRTKQVIVVKSGRHEAGARAAASHTGALAGSDEVYEAAFRRAGILRVTTIPELFNMSEILSMQPRPYGPALAIITNAGGPGVMATDALMTEGGQLAKLSDATMEALNSFLPPFWSHANPIDLLGDAGPDRYRKVVEVCARDPNINGLLLLLSPQAMTDPTETARQLIPFARIERKPVLATWMGGESVGEGREILNQAGIPTFDAPESAIRAFLHMVQYHRNQELLYERPETLVAGRPPQRDAVETLLQRVRKEGRTLLTEDEAKEVLYLYGIPVARTLPCPTVEKAVAAAREIGYPVVLKLLSKTITHKSDVGGVQLNLGDEAAVRRAYDTIRSNVAKHADAKAFEGVTVQPMIRQKGYELIVGSSIDRQFGPVILFGAGGVLVEIFKDKALALPPLNQTLARRMIERTQIARALAGVRGEKPVPPEQLEGLLTRFSLLVTDFLDIQEVDINPLLASAEGVIALDARILLCPADLPADQRPRLAIHPYPSQYAAPFKLRNGNEVLIRPVQPEDEPLLIALHASHSEHTIRMRFFSLVKSLSRDSLIRLCHLDYDREMALAAVSRDSAHPVMMGVSRYYWDPETNTAEFAVVVGDAWQRQGLGQHLMERLLTIARERGIATLTGQVLVENQPMLDLMQRLGFAVQPSSDPSIVQVSRSLT